MRGNKFSKWDAVAVDGRSGDLQDDDDEAGTAAAGGDAAGGGPWADYRWTRRQGIGPTCPAFGQSLLQGTELEQEPIQLARPSIVISKRSV
jgi:hypothetical protein